MPYDPTYNEPPPNPYSDRLEKSPFYQRQKAKYRPGAPIIPRYEFPRHYIENYFPTTPAVPQEQAVAQMKNYERLTASERWLYSMLPGVARGAEWLSKNTPTWAKPATSFAGKLLTKLDVGAEFIERGLGLAAQWNEARADPLKMQEFQQNLNSAWYAGSLFGDVTNLPTWDSDNNRFTFPTDLPGTAAMVQARNRIEELTNAGMDIGDATIQVREELYEDQGALALRSQLYDTYWHMIADPLNLLAFIKPVELVQKAAKIAGITKIADSVLDEVRLGIRVAEEAGDMAEIIARAEKYGVLTDITRTVLKKAETAGDINAAAKIAREALGTSTLTMTDKFALLLAGGDPFKMPATKWGQFLRRVNPFALPPSSRAYEYITQISNNINSQIVGPAGNAEEIMRRVGRVVDGVVGNDFGHAFLTLEGRYAQAVVAGAKAQLDDLYGAYYLARNDIGKLGDVARLADTDIHKVMQTILTGDARGLAAK